MESLGALMFLLLYLTPFVAGAAIIAMIPIFILKELVGWITNTVVENFKEMRYKRHTIYDYNLKYYKPITESKVALILEPVKEIYIKTEQDAARVFYRLMHFNKHFIQLSLFHELAMVLLLDKHDKLLVAVISSVGDSKFAIHNVPDVVYSYNASFGDCAKIIFAHTHVPNYEDIFQLKRKISDIIIDLTPSSQDLFEIPRLLNMKELQGMFKYCMILPGLLKRRVNYYTVIDLEKLQYYYAAGLLNSISPDKVTYTIFDEDYKKELEQMPSENFDVVYDATEKDEALDPTLVGIKLKYKKMPSRIISQAEGLKKWIEKQKVSQKS